MKRLAFVVAVVLLVPAAASAQAKNYELFRSEVGVSGTMGFGDPASYGFGAIAEPKINVLDNLAVGARVEAGLLFSGKIDTGTSEVSVGMRLIAAILAKADFFFTNTGVRPFAGFGLGYYTFAGAGGGTGGAGIDAGREFGIAPQLGVNFGGFRLAAMYHVIFGKALVTIDAGNTREISRNYLAIELSGRIRGKRIK